MTTDDLALVREYADGDSEKAFSHLVSRHINLVYSVAFRQVRDPHLAEEVTQDVFLLLARKARSLQPGTIVAAWLCRSARNVAANALTVQRRRQHREQEASMQSPSDDTDSHVWTRIEPLLEPAMGELRGKDYDAVVLRFFEGRSFREVAAALDTTEAGAKMRVGRALEKLRQFFARRGLAVSTAAIAGAVSVHSVQAAPIGLAASVTAAAAQATPTTTSLSTLFETALKSMAWSKLKTSLVVGALALLAAGTASVTLQRARTRSPFTFAGYATPEAAVQSTLWTASRGGLGVFTSALTAEQADQFQAMMAGKSEGEIKQGLVSWAAALRDYQVTQRDVISPDEVHLHLHATPSVEGLRTGKAVIVMKRIGQDWKKAGDVH